MKVVLDTNLLISALIAPRGVPDQLYRAWSEGRYTLLTSEAQLEEFRRVTRYPSVRRFVDPAAAGTMYNELHHLAVVLTHLPIVEVTTDPADAFLLATAKAGEADYLATGDKRDLLVLHAFARTQIVTARQLLRALGISLD